MRTSFLAIICALVLSNALTSSSTSVALAAGKTDAKKSPPASSVKTVWQPSPGHKQIPLWPATPPHASPYLGPEYISEQDGLTNVQKPTITVYSPRENNTGVAIIVYPGGGYKCLAMDLEGTEICDWLNSIGVTAVLLKYRVPSVKLYPARGNPQALDDAQRAMSIVRSRAAEWHIDPHKIGVLGFSAGGHLAAWTANCYARRNYTPVDALDKVSCRPDFSVPIYPGHLFIGNKYECNSDIKPTKNTPPTFILQNEDDPVDPVENSLVYYHALQKAGAPVEMHLYAQGGHAFGLRPSKLPVSKWPKLVETWLHTIGMIKGPE